MRKLFLGLLFVAPVVVPGSPATAVTIDWVTVGDAGNAADTTGYGAVASAYRIGETEVTVAQYTDFLNAVAGTADPNLLYHPNHGNNGIIFRDGSSGNYSYWHDATVAEYPITLVTFWDSVRFTNWLHNGQPTGAQGPSTTEDGAYTLTPAGIAANTIPRNPEATIFLPNEDEWYKAAYFDGTSYFDYPTGTDLATACAAPSASTNAANCDYAEGHTTDVGDYPKSTSPYGTLDQGGNVWEWNETIIDGSSRGQRGGSFDSLPEYLAAAHRSDLDPSFESHNLGFRVASIVPEPSTGLLVATGLLGLATSRRRRGSSFLPGLLRSSRARSRPVTR